MIINANNSLWYYSTKKQRENDASIIFFYVLGCDFRYCALLGKFSFASMKDLKTVLRKKNRLLHRLLIIFYVLLRPYKAVFISSGNPYNHVY